MMPKNHMVKFNIILDNNLGNKKATILTLKMMIMMITVMYSIAINNNNDT